MFSKTLAVALLFSVGRAEAQYVSAVTPAPVVKGGMQSAALSHGVQHGTKLYVVTMAEPHHAQKCRVHSFDDKEIICGVGAGKEPVTYREQDLLALMKRLPTNWHPYLPGFAFLGGGAGAIAGAIFLASVSVVGAIPVALVGGIALFIGVLLTSLEADEDDSLRWRVVYVRPGELPPDMNWPTPAKP